VHSAVFAAEHCVHAPARGPVAWQTGRAGSEQVGGPLPVHATQVRVAGEQ
jgi:hypothetical protein